MQTLNLIDHSLKDFLNEFKKHLEKTYTVEEVDATEDESICDMLDASHMITDYEAATFINCYKIEKESIGFTGYLINIMLNYKATTSKTQSGLYSDLQVIGMIKVKKCPHIFIKPESISDKVLDIVTRAEIDFPSHPEFSAKYYVVAEDKKEGAAKINHHFCDALNKLKKAFVEIKDEYLFVKFKKDSNFPDTDTIASFLEEVSLNKLLGKKESQQAQG